MKNITIEDMQKVAKERNFKCLSEKYISSYTHLEWQCSKGHNWNATSSNIKGGKGCPTCAGKYQTIEDMYRIAKERNFKCLSKEYINARTHLEWQCDKRHIWNATPDNIKRGKGCPTCVGRNKTIDDMHKIAKSRNGICLSKEYISVIKKLKWKCSEGHQWDTTPQSIMNGSWCPQCTFFYSEELCRTTFEQLFSKKFIKGSRKKWLVNSINEPMHLDGYCKELNIAFEYNGGQHYKIGYYTKNQKELNKRKLDDKIKSELCKKNGIHLFIITHKDNLITLPDLIKKQSISMSIDVSNINFEKQIDFNKVYQHKTKIEFLQNIAKNKKGKLLSKKYINTRLKLKWQCKEGHIWKANFNGIVYKNTWCPVCAGQIKKIEDMYKIAKEKKGDCLSNKYMNTLSPLKWKCSEGHIWNAKPRDIIAGHWCHICGIKKSSDSKRGSIEEMREIAKERNGKCLSKEYISAVSKLKWQCSEGHKWSSIPSGVREGKWCPKCAIIIRGKKKKLTIEEMHKLARAKKGKCLSSEYIDANTHLKWQCSEGHKWSATPGKIKMDRWCPICAKKINADKLRLTIEDMQKVASKNNGICVSKKYINIHTHLDWQCDVGHVWAATPHNIKAGRWCPKCHKGKVRKK
jgi:hypothetical protein